MMQPPSPASAYQQASARGATPVGQIVALYDTILRDLRRALDAIDSGNAEVRVFELNHALTVIAHLKSVLNHSAGGDAARRFDRFYQLTHGMILEANVSARRDSLLKLMDLYSSVREAWAQVEKSLPAAQPVAEPQQTPVAAPFASPGLPQGDSSATETPTGGSWSA